MLGNSAAAFAAASVFATASVVVASQVAATKSATAQVAAKLPSKLFSTFQTFHVVVGVSKSLFNICLAPNPSLANLSKKVIKRFSSKRSPDIPGASVTPSV